MLFPTDAQEIDRHGVLEIVRRAKLIVVLEVDLVTGGALLTVAVVAPEIARGASHLIGAARTDRVLVIVMIVGTAAIGQGPVTALLLIGRAIVCLRAKILWIGQSVRKATHLVIGMATQSVAPARIARTRLFGLI